jgi:hypothetical protein
MAIGSDRGRMLRPLTPRELLLLVLLALAVLGCGGEESVTGPAPLPSVAPSMAPPHAALPPHIFGAFASSADVPEIGPQGGNVVLVVPTYADDPERVALALQANGKVAIVSAHHVFGGPRETWGVDPAPGGQALAAPRAYQIHGATAVSVGGWLQTRDWMKPLEARGLVAAVYVVDEWVDRALITPARPPVDLYGVTCYSWPGPGSWSLDRCVEAYRTHPGWDLVFAQGFDLQQTTGYNGAVAAQIARWAALPRDFGRAGVLFWVARWPGQTGILDDPEMLAAYRKASSR